MNDRTMRLLLIEDDLIYARIVKTTLENSENMDIKIDSVDKVGEGVRRLQSTAYDMVISDISLPDSDEMETVNSVLKNAPGIPVLFLTSLDNEQVGIQAIQAGAQDFLIKTDTQHTMLKRTVRFTFERFNRSKIKPTSSAEKGDGVIRVLLVDDSNFILGVLKKMLHTTPDIMVVGTAKDGLEGLEKVKELEPDVVCTDLHMPKMDGFQFVKETMAKFPRPILVVSNAVQMEDTQNVFQLLEAGAVDVYPKPRHGFSQMNDYDIFAERFVEKIKLVANAPVLKAKKSRETPWQRTDTVPDNRPAGQLVLIGSPVGGPQALKALLPKFPADYSTPIVCVQILDHAFMSGFVQWLNHECPLVVEFARPGTKPKPGHVYFPMQDHHLEFDNQGQFLCTQTPPVNDHRPAIDITFKSAANFYKNAVTGVLLSGLSSDGFVGLKSIKQAGGTTILQHEEDSFDYSSIKKSLDLSAAQYRFPLNSIVAMLINQNQ